VPLAPRIAVFIALLIATVAAACWFDWQDQSALLEQREAEEVQLRQDWLSKKKLAVNLDAYKLQLEETDRQFGALLKQLPNRGRNGLAASRTSTRPVSGAVCSSSCSSRVRMSSRTSTRKCRSSCESSARMPTSDAFAEDVAAMPHRDAQQHRARRAKDGVILLDAKATT